MENTQTKTKEPRNVSLSTKVTKSEHRLVRKLAEKEGRSISNFLYNEVIKMLKRLGVNENGQ